MLRAVYGDPRAAAELMPRLTERQSAGLDPLPTEPAELAPTLLRAHRARIQSLPDDTRLLLLLAAADQYPLPTHAFLRAVTAARLDTRPLEAAEAAGVAQATAGGVVFRDAWTMIAAYETGSPADRREAHRLLARVLCGDGETPGRSWHRGAGALGPSARLAAELGAAARQAHDAGLLTTARALAERAAALSPDARDQSRLLALAAACAWQSGDGDRARRLAAAGPEEALTGVLALRAGNASEAFDALLGAAVLRGSEAGEGGGEHPEVPSGGAEGADARGESSRTPSASAAHGGQEHGARATRVPTDHPSTGAHAPDTAAHAAVPPVPAAGFATPRVAGGVGAGAVGPPVPDGAGAGAAALPVPDGVRAGSVVPRVSGGAGVGSADPRVPDGAGAGSATPPAPHGAGAGAAALPVPDGVRAGSVVPRVSGGAGVGSEAPPVPGRAGAGTAAPRVPHGAGVGTAAPPVPDGADAADGAPDLVTAYPFAPGPAARLLARATEAAIYTGDLRRCREAARAADRLGIVAPGTLGALAAAFDGRYEDARDLLMAAAGRCGPGGDPTLLMHAGIAALLLGDHTGAATATLRAAASARARGATATVVQAMEFRAYADFWTGRPRAGEAAAAEALGQAYATGQDNGACHLQAALAMFAAITGDADVCRERAATARSYALARGLGLPAALAQWALAYLDLSSGRFAAAAARLRALAGFGPGHGHRAIRHLATPHYVEAAVRTGDTRVARAAHADYHRWASAVLSPDDLALSARCRALLVPGEEAVEHYREALELHSHGTRDFERARTELLFGSALRRLRRRTEARDRLHSALEAFDSFGAPHCAAQARTELRALGAPSPPASTAPDGLTTRLTAQQLLVARMAAEGATNREIADRLALSPRTIDHHLRGVFTRLDIRSRIELVRLLGEVGD
ncbi:LuxR C-terminal-related transcriptional regulator [Streptomyces sp. NPDC058678]|uniref:helix-turn-helix transcriptional regulator n=1 Tax=Streptomyces sp. NPDC058678 TaxID=3346595 RepID=UPI00364D7C77